MTDDEIRSSLAKADELMEAYKKIVQPVADELARRKSVAVYGEPGRYEGHLGCWEAGIDTICLHIADGAGGDAYDHVMHSRAIDMEIAMVEKLGIDHLKNVHISGHM